MNNENMLPVGTQLRGGTYIITKQLSSGGFGNTYVVQNVSFNETYAMKEFFMRGINLRNGGMVTVSVPDNKAAFESQKTKLKKEAQRLRKLHNEHIVQVHDLFEERGTIYYVMDYIDGESLDSYMRRTNKPLGENEALGVFYQLLDALSLVHSQSPQLLHLDIKPANIMMDRSGCVYLIDFGASKQIVNDENNTFSTTTGMSYTAGYAPSEQIEQNYERMGPWTDFYALGATLYKLVTLQQPPSPSNIGDDGESVFHFPTAISEHTRQLIRWMMAPSRTMRPQTVDMIKEYLQHNFEVQSDMTEVTSYEPVSLSTTIKPSSPKSAKKSALFYALGMLSVFSIGLCIWWKTSSDSENVLDNTIIVDSVDYTEEQQSTTEISKIKKSLYVSKQYNHDLYSRLHHHLVGYFYDSNNRRYPVELDFNSDNGQLTDIVYKNINYKVQISMSCNSFDGTCLHLIGEGRNRFSISLRMDDNGDFMGSATEGNSTLSVWMEPQCSH